MGPNLATSLMMGGWMVAAEEKDNLTATATNSQCPNKHGFGFFFYDYGVTASFFLCSTYPEKSPVIK